MKNLKPERVFHYFEEISAVPRGSGNCTGIMNYCENFANSHNLKYYTDEACNTVIFKNGTHGYENSETVILQGHTDMVCQKTDKAVTDFIHSGVELFTDGDFLKGRETTLGADNGIAVAMILAILESTDIPHPPIEAVFTADEEIGLIGASKLDMSILKGKKIINLDSEDDDTVTVSCAGGSDLTVKVPLSLKKAVGTKVVITLKGLKGGHSGVEITDNRVNAATLGGRFLNHIKKCCDFDIISIAGGDKSNAIPNSCKIELCTQNYGELEKAAEDYLEIIKAEISDRENNFHYTVENLIQGEFDTFSDSLKEKLIFVLLCVPNGIMEMSSEIDGLAQTSLNLGVLNTENGSLNIGFGLRSNKKSGLDFLEEKLIAFFDSVNWTSEVSGHYPPWEYRETSQLRELYKEVYTEHFGVPPKIEAIHAGLECGVFSNAIEGIDCISVGPTLRDVHTVNERLSISSTENIYTVLLKILEKLK